MKTGELKAKSLAQLRDYAADLDVVGRHRMSKEELIDAILDAKAQLAARHERRSTRPLSARPAPVATDSERPGRARPATAGRKTVAREAATGKASVKTKKSKDGSSQEAAMGTKSQARAATPIRKPAAPAEPAAPARGLNAASKKPTTPAAAARPAPARLEPASTPAGKAAPAPAVKAAAPAVAKAPPAPAVKPAPAAAKAPPAPAARPAPPKAGKTEVSRSLSAPAPIRQAPAAQPTDKRDKLTSSAKAAPASRPAPAVKAASKVRKVTPKATRSLHLQVDTLRVRTRKAKPAPKPEPPPKPRAKPSRRKVASKRSYRLTPAAPALDLRAGIIEGELPKPPARGPGAVEKPASVQPPLAPLDYLPTIYQDDRLVLLARDPQWMHCYWEFSEATMTAIRDSLARNGGNLVLRVHDVTGIAFDGLNSHRYQDLVLPEQPQGNWYFQSLGSDIDHLIEIGIRSREDRFVAFARSNVTRTPRAVEAPIVTFESQVPPEVAGLGTTGPRETADEPQAAPAASQPLAPGKAPSMVQPGHPSSLAGPIGPHGFVPTSPAGPPGAPTSPGAALVHVPGSVVPQQAKERSFWLVVDAELIVYGATVPEAKVTLQGQPIQLRPDGTFSARFALPDGQQVIPVEATSPDGVDHRVVTPVVERQTRESD